MWEREKGNFGGKRNGEEGSVKIWEKGNVRRKGMLGGKGKWEGNLKMKGKWGEKGYGKKRVDYMGRKKYMGIKRKEEM